MRARAALTPTAKLRFSGHQTFPLRHGWLTKAALGIGEDRELFRRKDALVRLGVGKNMVASIRHWSQATGVLEISRGPARLTGLGTHLFGQKTLPPPPPPPPPPVLIG